MDCDCQKMIIELTPSENNLEVQRGMVTEFECNLTNAYLEPFDISLDTVLFTVRDFKGGNLKIQKINLPLSHIDGPQGRTRFRLEVVDIVSAEIFRALSWVFEVRRITPANEDYIHIVGDFVVLPEVGA